MDRARERVLLAWSGGKESAMAIRTLQKEREYEVIGLITAVTEGEEQVLLRGVHRALIEAQAQALNLPLSIAYVPRDCCRRTHINKICMALAPLREAGIRKVAFGDLFLDDMRDLREETLEAAGMEAIFPLWHRDTQDLAHSFLREKFKAVVTCVEEQSLDARFVGRPYDRTFLGELPLSVDPCGENGEFHTFVFDGPCFRSPVLCKTGETFTATQFHYCEISIQPQPKPKKSTTKVI